MNFQQDLIVESFLQIFLFLPINSMNIVYGLLQKSFEHFEKVGMIFNDVMSYPVVTQESFYCRKRFNLKYLVFSIGAAPISMILSLFVMTLRKDLPVANFKIWGKVINGPEHVKKLCKNLKKSLEMSCYFFLYWMHYTNTEFQGQKEKLLCNLFVFVDFIFLHQGQILYKNSSNFVDSLLIFFEVKKERRAGTNMSAFVSLQLFFKVIFCLRFLLRVINRKGVIDLGTFLAPILLLSKFFMEVGILSHNSLSHTKLGPLKFDLRSSANVVMICLVFILFVIANFVTQKNYSKLRLQALSYKDHLS